MKDGFIKATITNTDDENIGVHVTVQDVTNEEILAGIACLASDCINEFGIDLDDVLYNIKNVHEKGF